MELYTAALYRAQHPNANNACSCMQLLCTGKSADQTDISAAWDGQYSHELLPGCIAWGNLCTMEQRVDLWSSYSFKFIHWFSDSGSIDPEVGRPLRLVSCLDLFIFLPACTFYIFAFLRLRAFLYFTHAILVISWANTVTQGDAGSEANTFTQGGAGSEANTFTQGDAGSELLG